ncbi:hypothetical protein B7L70_09855 [Vulcanisaeta sp. EB80]|uniref:hypothetical protein n=1 Tax=Vulcanisaeta sp. EB80 TaxID=1650660 RepID=UPI0009C0B237|nr:hypothetical protein [Vulcanisaeta sp. EB80]PLC65963.1 hypothetical protein B7L70_09855 [Vulcanisaeta sp. EB80]
MGLGMYVTGVGRVKVGRVKPYLLMVGALTALILALVVAAQPITLLRSGLVVNILSTNGSLIGIVAYGHNLAVSHVAMRLIEPNQNYLVVAYSFNVTQDKLIEYIGYTYVNGSMLLRVLAGGSAALYSWVKGNIVLKPLNQYPRANVTVIVKAPNGEPVSNGTVCALLAPPVFLPFVFSPHMTSPYGELCVKVSNGIAEFSNLPQVPYYLVYTNIIRLGGGKIIVKPIGSEVINIYGVPVNVTSYEEIINITRPSFVLLTGMNMTIPNNGTVIIKVRLIEQIPIIRPVTVASPALPINESSSFNIDPADIVYMLSGASSIVPSISTGTTTGAPKVVTVGGMGQAKPPVPYGLVVLIVALAVMVGLTMAIVALRLAVRSR